MSEADPILELEALLDPARLAAAWQVARERPPEAAAEVAGVDPGAGDQAPEAPSPEAPSPEAPAPVEGEPARAVALPVGLAHRQLLGEIDRTLAASPGLAAKARRVLAAPLAELAQKIDPVDPAAEAALDQLEDVLWAVLSEAGWPEGAESPESED